MNEPWRTEATLAVPLDDLRRVFYEHNLCRKAAGVADDATLLDRIKELLAIIGDDLRLPSAKDGQITRLRGTLEQTRPLLKRLAVEGSEEACRVLGEIEEVLQ